MAKVKHLTKAQDAQKKPRQVGKPPGLKKQSSIRGRNTFGFWTGRMCQVLLAGIPITELFPLLFVSSMVALAHPRTNACHAEI